MIRRARSQLLLLAVVALLAPAGALRSVLRSRRAAAGTLAALVLAPAASLVARPPDAAHASYRLYKAAADERDSMIQAGTWKQGRDVDDAAFQGAAARTEAERVRALKYSKAAKSGSAGKYCAGQTSTVSPMMENLCVRIGSSKADQATQTIDQFGSAQQSNRNVE
jgi:hypothetical protein